MAAPPTRPRWRWCGGVAALLVAALLLLDCVPAEAKAHPGRAARTARTQQWCYGMAWCHGLRARITEDRRTWPSYVSAVRFYNGSTREDEIRKTFFTDSESTNAELEDVLEEILNDMPYPVSVRHHPPTRYHEGHNETLYDPKGKVMNLTGPKPAFIEPGFSVDVMLGDDVTLHCKVRDVGGHAILWLINNQTVSCGSQMTSPNVRLSARDNGTLTVSRTEWDDHGHYTCQIGSIGNFVQDYVVNIIAAAAIHVPAPVERHISLAWRGTCRMTCSTSGSPLPSIRWIKRGKPAVLSTSPDFVISNATREDSGTYMCVVYNGVGSRQLEKFTVETQYPPEITCSDEGVSNEDKSIVNVIITCSVDALPSADMASWLVPGFTVGEVRIQGENMRITEVGRYQGIVLGNYSTLQFVVSNFTAHDLGDYSISVRNSVAETTVLHEVTANAQPVTFTCPEESPYETAYNVTFDYESYLPALEVRLQYRQHHSKHIKRFSYDSQGIVISPSYDDVHKISAHVKARRQMAGAGMYDWVDKSSKRPEPVSWVLLTGLEPASNYEAIVQVRNERGWNEAAGPHHFFTKGAVRQVVLVKGGNVAASTSAAARGLSETPPLLLAALLALLAMTAEAVLGRGQ